MGHDRVDREARQALIALAPVRAAVVAAPDAANLHPHQERVGRAGSAAKALTRATGTVASGVSPGRCHSARSSGVPSPANSCQVSPPSSLRQAAAGCAPA
ncbi:MAG: hypothetical protein U0841_06615 [Chloroflexia bacterium]